MEEEIFKNEVLEVDVSKISMNPYQPRRNFSEQELGELALSIKTIGLIHPPVVRPLKQGPHEYELVSGERRFRAVQLAGFKTIAVIVKSSSNSLSAQAALIENIQRVDLNPIEIAKGLHQLIENFGLNQEHIASRIGKKRSTIANYLRLMSLPETIQNSLESGMITMGHAKGLLSLPDESEQQTLYEKVLDENLSVRETEDAARRYIEKKTKRSQIQTKDVHIERLEDMIREKLGTGVKIHGKHQKGRVCIDYYSLDDLERILQHLGVEEL